MTAAVVVLPWVPVIRMIFLPAATNRFTAWGMDR